MLVPSRTPHRMVARSSVIALVVALSVGLVLSIGGVAHASGSVDDSYNFEADDWKQWNFTRVGNGVGGINTQSAQAFSPTRSGFVHIKGPGFSSVGRPLNLPGAAEFHRSDCAAAIWVNAAGKARKLNLEVIDPTTFTYVALKQVALDPAQDYVQIGLNWKAGVGSGTPADVLVRVSMLGNSDGTGASAWVDDLVVGCFWT